MALEYFPCQVFGCTDVWVGSYFSKNCRNEKSLQANLKKLSGRGAPGFSRPVYHYYNGPIKRSWWPLQGRNWRYLWCNKWFLRFGHVPWYGTLLQPLNLHWYSIEQHQLQKANFLELELYLRELPTDLISPLLSRCRRSPWSPPV